MRKGTRWTGKLLEWSAEWEIEDDNINEPTDKRCMKIVREMSNTIREDIQMVEDIPSNYPDGKLPVLDFKVWKSEYGAEGGVQRTQIQTEFYEKEMVGDRLLMEKSALPKKVKIASLAQMVIRRCTNQIGVGERDLKTRHLSKLMLKMRKSGYNYVQRMEVLLECVAMKG